MFSINRTERGRIGYCVETEPDAITTTGRDMAVAFAREHAMPLIVVGDMHPNGVVVIHNDLIGKASAMLGDRVARLAPDVTMFSRKDP
jgi:hypothetical protein